RREVSALTDARKTLAYDFFRILRAPRNALSLQAPCPDIIRINRFAFYERAQKAFAIVITGERAKYGNILLKKGVTP
ncbi:RbsD/FucU domain-containing protein, partial [Escherichia coli]|uniref:RbsD/FucU domain-containing protein n=1 Tax=Escherichia coli TaxID=562 RepID=UPI0025464EE3